MIAARLHDDCISSQRSICDVLLTSVVVHCLLLCAFIFCLCLFAALHVVGCPAAFFCVLVCLHAQEFYCAQKYFYMSFIGWHAMYNFAICSKT